MAPLNCNLDESDCLSTFSDIPQIDGNISVSSSDADTDVSLLHSSSSIPVHISSRTFVDSTEKRISFNKVIKRDNRHLESSNLPSFTVYNMRSLWSKIDNLADDIIERAVDISFLSEIWEKKGKP